MTCRTLLASGTLALACSLAQADPGYYVVTVYSEPGVRSLDYRYWTFKRPGAAVVTWPELALGWNVNSRWYTELLASWIGGPHRATSLSTLNWQNDLLLTQGEWPVDVALHTLLVRPQNGQPGYTLEFGPVLQTDVGRTQVNFNAVFERGLGAASAQPTQLKYQWQLRHRWTPGLHLGAQGFGELGTWDNWAAHKDQSHRAGPAVFGDLPSTKLGLDWQAAYLVGKTYRKHGDMFTMRVKLKF